MAGQFKKNAAVDSHQLLAPSLKRKLERRFAPFASFPFRDVRRPLFLIIIIVLQFPFQFAFFLCKNEGTVNENEDKEEMA
jgi:hypothetical protein